MRRMLVFWSKVLFNVLFFLALVFSDAYSQSSTTNFKREIAKIYKQSSPQEAAIKLKDLLQNNGVDLSEIVYKKTKITENTRKIPIPKWLIHLPNGNEFIPDKGIDVSLREKLNLSNINPDEKVVCLLQLTPDLTYSDIIQILENDIKIFELINKNTYLVRLPLQAVNWIKNQLYFRWIGEYKSTYKYNPEKVIKNNALVYTITKDEISFREELRQLGISIQNYNTTLNCYEVSNISTDIFYQLAELWWIRKIGIPSKAQNLAMENVTVNFEPNDSRELVMAYDTQYLGNGVTIGVLEPNRLWENHPQLGSSIFNEDSELGGDSLHATHVTGIIAGRAKSIAGLWGNTEIKGVLPESNILFRAMDDLFSTYVSDLNSFRDNSIQISNHSWRFLYFGDAVYEYDGDSENFDQYADENDMLFVVGVGNDDNREETISNPALAKNTVGIGNLLYVSSVDYKHKFYESITPDTIKLYIEPEQLGKLSYYSSLGPTRDDKRLKPELVAPGGGETYYRGVVSTNSRNWFCDWSGNSLNDNYEYPEWQSDDDFIRLSGTSMAAPHVTGIAGKIKQWDPHIRSEEIKAILINTAIPIRDNSSNPLYGYANTKVGYGMVNGYLVTNDIPGETERLLSFSNEVTEDNRTYTTTVDIPSGVKYFAVTMAYNDLAGESSDTCALKNDLNLKLIAPSGQEYVFWENKPSNIRTGSPIEKMVIDEDYMEEGTWTVEVDFIASPHFPENDPLHLHYAEEDFSVFLHAFYTRPELQLSATANKSNLQTGEEFTISTTITNIGGNIAAGVTVVAMEVGKDINNSSLGGDAYKYRYVGNLIGKNSAVSPKINLTAPTEPGDYTIEIEADAINRELQNNTYPKRVEIPIHVYSSNLTIDHYLDKSTYYPNESGLYTVVLKDENGNPASGYSVEYVVETEWGSAIQTGDCPETSTPGTYESVGFSGPSDIGNYTIHSNIYYDGESITHSDNINFSVIEKGENTLSLVANPNPCDKYSTTVLTATYLDFEGNPIEGEQIEFTSYIDGTMEGGDVAPNIATTDANGKASVNFTPEGESGNIKASSVNNSDIEDIIELQVSSSGELRVEIQVKAEEIGETVSYYDLDIRAYNQDDELVQDAVINSVTTTLGTVDSYSPTTGGYGIGDADISTTESGESIITVDVEGSIGQTSTYFQVGASDALEPVIEIIPNNMVKVNGIDWSSDNQKFLIAIKDNSNEEGRIDIYDTNNWNLINSIPSNDGETYGAAFSHDVTKVVGSHNGAYTTHNINNGNVIKTTRDPDGNDESRFTFWNNSDKIISIGHKDGYDRSVAMVLRGSDLSVLHVLTDGTSSPDQMDYCQETDKIAVADGDYVYCYNGSSYSLEKTFELKDVSACFNGSGSRLAVSRDNDYIRIFNYNNSNFITDITGSWDNEFSDMDWSQDNEYLAGYNKDREVYIFDYDPANDTGHELYKMSIDGTRYGTLKWNHASNLLAVENEEKVLIYSPTDVIDPQLSVDYPIDTLYTYESSITTTGNTNDENGIKLLKIITPTTTHEITDLPDGNFSQPIALSEGENIIQYISYDNNWNSTEIDRVIIRNTDQSGPTISDVSVNKDEIEVNETGILTAKIIDDVSGVLEGSTKCIMHNIDSTVAFTLLLYDDGTHGDPTPNDNYFSCIIDPTDLDISILDATYYFDIEAKDNSASQNQSYNNNADNAFIYDNPVISEIKINPEAPTSDDSLFVSCLITDFSEISTATFYLKNINNDNYVPYELFNVSDTDTFKNTIEPQIAGQYQYFIKGVDEYGKYSYSDTLSLTIDEASPITDDPSMDIPKVYTLYQSFPNPFNPITTIKFDLPKSSKVKIVIYNYLGQEVKTLVNKVIPAGQHRVTFDGSGLSSGVYFYKIMAEDYINVKKMLLIK